MWPELHYPSWQESLETLHRWAQIIGKVRLAKSPWINHSWGSTLYVTAHGLTTSVIHDGGRSFSIDLDLVEHRLRIWPSDGPPGELALIAEPVASFFERCTTELHRFGIDARIAGTPNELPDATPFAQDHIHHSYDPEYASRFFRILLQADRLMKLFRSRFIGKSSPVHFFWGGFDLAVTRFSGRRAPEHPGGIPHLPDRVTREAYSHEVSSCGFWPGDPRYPEAAFYSYAYPQPPGFERARMPRGVFYHQALRELLLPYEVVRTSSDPDALVLEFFESAYVAAADLGHWDRQSLEYSRYLDELRARSA